MSLHISKWQIGKLLTEEDVMRIAEEHITESNIVFTHNNFVNKTFMLYLTEIESRSNLLLVAERSFVVRLCFNFKMDT